MHTYAIEILYELFFNKRNFQIYNFQYYHCNSFDIIFTENFIFQEIFKI